MNKPKCKYCGKEIINITEAINHICKQKIRFNQCWTNATPNGRKKKSIRKRRSLL